MFVGMTLAENKKTSNSRCGKWTHLQRKKQAKQGENLHSHHSQVQETDKNTPSAATKRK